MNSGFFAPLPLRLFSLRCGSACSVSGGFSDSRPWPRLSKRPGAGENSRTMPNKDAVVVILAAGKGTRLKSSVAKVLHPVGGRPLVEHVMRACTPLRPKRIVAVVGHQAEQVTAVLEPLEAHTVLQQPQ